MSGFFAIDEIINRNNQFLGIHKSYHNPKLSSESILTKEPWEYVTHFLNTKVQDSASTDNVEEAIYFWDQAKEFYKLSSHSNSITKPLLLYYCFLNASKALLAFNKKLYKKNLHHGIRQISNNHSLQKSFDQLLQNSSPKLLFKSKADIRRIASTQQKTTNIKLKDNFVVFCKGDGVLTKLAEYLDNELHLPKLYSLNQLVSNLVFIHRAYSLNNNLSIKEQLFIPLDSGYFVEDTRGNVGGKYFGYLASADRKYVAEIDKCSLKESDNIKIEKMDSRTLLILDKTNETTGEIDEKLKNHSLFFRYLRKNHQYIAGSDLRWYLMKSSTSKVENLELHPLVIMFAVFHYLSELARYNPLKLKSMLDSRKNSESWLLYELIEGAGFQFIDIIAAEITGEELKIPRIY